MKIENLIFLPSTYLVPWWLCVTIKNHNIAKSNSSLEYIRSSSMVAEKNPPKPEVVSDDDGDDEDVQERQEIVRENQILRQGTFLLLFWKSVAFFCPHLFTFIF